ncbi:MAG: hypothetical protein GY947_01930 [Rhodobacteraceae bacterium]|nr:hypothetical protein [Paracoccaceae bacterium]
MLENISTICQRLREIGYLFEAENQTNREITPPVYPVSDDAIRMILELNHSGDAVPIIIETFANIVGNVDFRQSWDDPTETADPVLAHLGDWDPFYFDLEYAAYSWHDADQIAIREEERLTFDSIEFAPDIYHKCNVSGGAGYEVELNQTSFDPVISIPLYMGELKRTFTQYLRDCLLRGGFLGAGSLVLDRGYGWLGTLKVERKLFLPEHPVFKKLASDLVPF